VVVVVWEVLLHGGVRIESDEKKHFGDGEQGGFGFHGFVFSETKSHQKAGRSEEDRKTTSGGGRY